MERAIDVCVGTHGSHHDIARVIHMALCKRFRYCGDNVWEWLRDSEWVKDENRRELITAIRVEVAPLYTERALYWQEYTMNAHAIEQFDCQLRCHGLLQIAIKLSKEKFIRDLVKECREYFVTESH
jgi:hypothetical protein